MVDLNEQERVAPQKLMGSFSKNRLMLCVLLAVGAHVVIIAGASLDYIYYSWLNPEAGRAREAALKAEQEAKRKGKAPDNAISAAPTNASSAGVSSDTAKPVSSGDSEKAMMEKHKTSKVVKEITEKAKPEEIPEMPDDLGISTKDTNPF